MVLLDTCAIIWDALDPSKLSKKAKTAIENADKNNSLIISDISIWEISMLIKKNRIQVEATATQLIKLYLQTRNIRVQPITPEIADLSVNFDSKMNKDPADRIISATAIVCDAKLVTSDRNLIANELLDTVW
ncbi:MAG: PIN domain-containing protein [Gammaproteobacteria bacterium]|nr:MAG: PIN domain-containing protein [Gammaproteobacteria bacterium]